MLLYKSEALVLELAQLLLLSSRRAVAKSHVAASGAMSDPVRGLVIRWRADVWFAALAACRAAPSGRRFRALTAFSFASSRQLPRWSSLFVFRRLHGCDFVWHCTCVPRLACCTAAGAMAGRARQTSAVRCRRRRQLEHRRLLRCLCMAAGHAYL